MSGVPLIPTPMERAEEEALTAQQMVSIVMVAMDAAGENLYQQTATLGPDLPGGKFSERHLEDAGLRLGQQLKMLLSDACGRVEPRKEDPEG